MSKFLFYLALLLMLGATLLGYFNERRFRYIILNQDSIIQEQHDNAAGIEKELKELKESVASQSTDQEKNKKELSDAKEAQAKATNELTQAQKQLADKDAEMAQLKSDLSVKAARVQELEAAIQILSQPEELSKSKNASAKGKGAHTEMKREPAKKEIPSHEIGASTQEGKILAVNGTWNFVVISIGSHDGMVAGTEISIKHDGQLIAKAKVTSVEASTSVADLVMNSVVAGTTVQAGDQVLVSEVAMGK